MYWNRGVAQPPVPEGASPTIDEIGAAYELAASGQGRDATQLCAALSIYLHDADPGLEQPSCGEHQIHARHPTRQPGDARASRGESVGREHLPTVLREFVISWLGDTMLLHLRQTPELLPELEQFALWLADEGYVDATVAADIARLARRLQGKLLRAERAKKRLARACRGRAPVWDLDADAEHTCFEVTRIEPGLLWLRPRYQEPALYGPIKVPVRAGALLERGWDLWCTLLAEGGRWHLDSVGQVVPVDPLGVA